MTTTINHRVPRSALFLLLLSVLLLDPRGDVQAPRDRHQERTRHVQGLDGVRGYGVQDVGLVDAVGTRRERNERDDAEAARRRLCQRGAEHLRRGRLALPVSVEHHRGGGHLRGGGCETMMDRKRRRWRRRRWRGGKVVRQNRGCCCTAVVEGHVGEGVAEYVKSWRRDDRVARAKISFTKVGSL